MKSINTTRLRRRLIGSSLGYLFVSFLLLAVLGAYPLYQHITQQQQDHFQQQLMLRARALGEGLHHLTEVALLLSYAQPPPQAADTTDQTWAPYLTHSDILAGFMHLDPQGDVSVALGQTINKQWRAQATSPHKGPVLSRPFYLRGKMHLVMSVPIPAAETAGGRDLFLFQSNELEQHLGLLPHPFNQARISLWKQNQKQQHLLWPSSGRDILQCQPPGPLDNPKHGQWHSGKQLCAYAQVPGSKNWLLVGALPRQAVTHMVSAKLVPLGGLMAVLMLLGGVGLYILLRPLSGRVLTYPQELEAINSQLQDEIQRRTSLARTLDEQRQQWAQIFESLSDAVVVHHQQPATKRFNAAARQLLAGLAEEDQQRLLNLDNADATQDVHLPSQDSFHQIATTALLDHQGTPQGYIQIIHDVTERRRLEQMKSEMLASVSHEMRTPLTAISGFVEFMLENVVPRPQQQEFLQIMDKEMQRLNELINNFMELQRLQSRVTSYHWEPVELEGLLKECCNLFWNSRESHPLTLNCPETLPAIKGDYTRLLQVFKNLITNAIKYSPHGGAITINVKHGEQHVTVAVKDQGIGIAQPHQYRIFERFYRVDDSDRRIPGGVGLGLALVK